MEGHTAYGCFESIHQSSMVSKIRVSNWNDNHLKAPPKILLPPLVKKRARHVKEKPSDLCDWRYTRKTPKRKAQSKSANSLRKTLALWNGTADSKGCQQSQAPLKSEGTLHQLAPEGAEFGCWAGSPKKKRKTKVKRKANRESKLANERRTHGSSVTRELLRRYEAMQMAPNPFAEWIRSALPKQDGFYKDGKDIQKSPSGNNQKQDEQSVEANARSCKIQQESERATEADHMSSPSTTKQEKDFNLNEETEERDIQKVLSRKSTTRKSSQPKDVIRAKHPKRSKDKRSKSLERVTIRRHVQRTLLPQLLRKQQRSLDTYYVRGKAEREGFKISRKVKVQMYEEISSGQPRMNRNQHHSPFKTSGLHRSSPQVRKSGVKLSPPMGWRRSTYQKDRPFLDGLHKDAPLSRISHKKRSDLDVLYEHLLCRSKKTSTHTFPMIRKGTQKSQEKVEKWLAQSFPRKNSPLKEEKYMNGGKLFEKVPSSPQTIRSAKPRKEAVSPLDSCLPPILHGRLSKTSRQCPLTEPRQTVRKRALLPDRCGCWTQQASLGYGPSGCSGPSCAPRSRGDSVLKSEKPLGRVHSSKAKREVIIRTPSRVKTLVSEQRTTRYSAANCAPVFETLRGNWHKKFSKPLACAPEFTKQTADDCTDYSSQTRSLFSPETLSGDSIEYSWQENEENNPHKMLKAGHSGDCLGEVSSGTQTNTCLELNKTTQGEETMHESHLEDVSRSQGSGQEMEITASSQKMTKCALVLKSTAPNKGGFLSHLEEQAMLCQEEKDEFLNCARDPQDRAVSEISQLPREKEIWDREWEITKRQKSRLSMNAESSEPEGVYKYLPAMNSVNRARPSRDPKGMMRQTLTQRANLVAERVHHLQRDSEAKSNTSRGRSFSHKKQSLQSKEDDERKGSRDNFIKRSIHESDHALKERSSHASEETRFKKKKSVMIKQEESSSFQTSRTQSKKSQKDDKEIKQGSIRRDTKETGIKKIKDDSIINDDASELSDTSYSSTKRVSIFSAGTNSWSRRRQSTKSRLLQSGQFSQIFPENESDEEERFQENKEPPRQSKIAPEHSTIKQERTKSILVNKSIVPSTDDTVIRRPIRATYKSKYFTKKLTIDNILRWQQLEKPKVRLKAIRLKKGDLYDDSSSGDEDFVEDEYEDEDDEEGQACNMFFEHLKSQTTSSIRVEDIMRTTSEDCDCIRKEHVPRNLDEALTEAVNRKNNKPSRYDLLGAKLMSKPKAAKANDEHRTNSKKMRKNRTNFKTAKNNRILDSTRIWKTSKQNILTRAKLSRCRYSDHGLAPQNQLKGHRKSFHGTLYDRVLPTVESSEELNQQQVYESNRFFEEIKSQLASNISFVNIAPLQTPRGKEEMESFRNLDKALTEAVATRNWNEKSTIYQNHKDAPRKISRLNTSKQPNGQGLLLNPRVNTLKTSAHSEGFTNHNPWSVAAHEVSCRRHVDFTRNISNCALQTRQKQHNSMETRLQTRKARCQFPRQYKSLHAQPLVNLRAGTLRALRELTDSQDSLWNG